MRSGRLLSVNVVHELLPDRAGDLDFTAIDKRPVRGRVRVHRLGVAGDRQYDTRHHGGVDQAVYAYAVEDAAWWAGELDRAVGPGAFGENLTTEGVAVTDAVVGERWAVGTAVLQVCCPRIPCRTFQGYWGVAQLVKRFTAHGAPGAYLRVLTAGVLAAGDRLDVLDRPEHGLTIGETFRALTGERALVPKLLTAPELPAETAHWATKVLTTP